MDEKDIRWKQRFANLKKAFSQLSKFIEKHELNDLERQGLIQSFEYTFELAWNVIKDYYEYQGETGIQGSRDAFRLAINRNLIDNGELWMEMIQSRAKTSHTYNEEIAEEIANSIVTNYFNLFKALIEKFESIEG
jgi:nucleotidyltransferase substrate binding protein (TIGR01987 family)